MIGLELGGKLTLTSHDPVPPRRPPLQQSRADPYDLPDRTLP